jgi:hypothetical protein
MSYKYLPGTPKTADFDHILYYQEADRFSGDWQPPDYHTPTSVKLNETHGLVHGGDIYRKKISGRAPNEDQYVSRKS